MQRAPLAQGRALNPCDNAPPSTEHDSIFRWRDGKSNPAYGPVRVDVEQAERPVCSLNNHPTGDVGDRMNWSA
jgi:hypothetical protein